MALPNVTINLENGNLGRIAQSDDGVAGLILTGAAVSDKLALNEVYLINSSRDIARLGITAENNPLAHKELTALLYGDGRRRRAVPARRFRGHAALADVQHRGGLAAEETDHLRQRPHPPGRHQPSAARRVQRRHHRYGHRQGCRDGGHRGAVRRRELRPEA